MNSDGNSFQYSLDKNNHIVAVNQLFIDFAQQNAWDLDIDDLIGRPLLAFIDGQETQLFTELLLARARDNNQCISVPFRCDSHHSRRYLSMTISPMDNGVLGFSNQLLKVESRSSLEALSADVAVADPQYKVCMCSWCNSFQISDYEWAEAEVAVDKLYLFANNYKEKYISHGICPDCQKIMMEGMKRG